jgi:Tfp pilus assembly protein PilO
MTTLLDKLNLRPQERRLVVMATAVLFVVLQFWLVWPHFKDWEQVKAGLTAADKNLKTYQTEIALTNEYRLKLAELEQQGDTILAAEEAQPNILIQKIQSQAGRSKLNVLNISPTPRSNLGRANQFFEEQTIGVGLNPTGDEELIDFLVAMGSGDLMVRVKELDLRPDPSRTKLMGKVTLVASFQRNRPDKTSGGRPAP